MKTKTKLNQTEVKQIECLIERLDKLYFKYEKKDIKLNYGNGTVSEQLNCAVAALTTIIQEY